MANKPPADIEQYKSVEKRLLAVLEIRTNLQRLKEQPIANQPIEKKKSVSSVQPMVFEASQAIPELPQMNIPELVVQVKPPEDRFITFRLKDGQVKQILYTSETKYEHIRAELQIEDPYRLEVQLREDDRGVFKTLALDQFIEELIPVGVNLEGQLVEKFLVNSGNEGTKYFYKGTKTERVKAVMKAKDYTFFDSNFAEVIEEELMQDLYLLDCEKVNVTFKGEVFRKKLVPLNIPIRELPKFLSIGGPNTLHASSARINDKWIELDPERTLQEVTKGATIEEIRLSYLIDLSI